MFRVKTRRIKRPVSPPPELPASPLVAPVAPVVPINPPPSVIAPVSDMSGAEAVIPEQKAPTTLMGRLTNFFEAESAAVSITKPWLRLERGLRLQKLRTFAENYPGLSDEDKETLNKTLVKANDAKLLNTKQQIVYEGGKIMAIRGLKVTKTGDPLQPASFKIEIPRQTKKKNND
jgi:hypothetical protein